MLIEVRLFNGVLKTLTYHVPEEFQNHIRPGSIVRVPLRNSVVSGLVQEMRGSAAVSFKIRSILMLEPLPHDQLYPEFIKKIAIYYQIEPVHLWIRLKTFIEHKRSKKAQSVDDQMELTGVNQLTGEQQNVVDFISSFIKKPSFSATLLQGVTGSGKTEVYKRLMETAWHENKTTIFLLPDVSLALQFQKLLTAQLTMFGAVEGFHSGVSDRHKKRVWQRLINGDPLILVGVHQPVMLPVANLGLIIIDEEHDTGYQEKKHPKMNSKEVALLRARDYNIPILLGSATPSITSLYNTRERGWHFFEMKQRFAGSMPTIKIAPLIDKKSNAPTFGLVCCWKMRCETVCNKASRLFFLLIGGDIVFLFSAADAVLLSVVATAR